MTITPLNIRDMGRFKKAVGELHRKLLTQKTQKFLVERGIDPKEVIDGLDKLNPIDGIRTTVSATLCGIIEGECDVPLSQFVLKRYPQVFACVGINREDTLFNIYFFGQKGFKPCHIFHELLHSVTGLNDADLINKLKFDLPSRNSVEIGYSLEREAF